VGGLVHELFPLGLVDLAQAGALHDQRRLGGELPHELTLPRPPGPRTRHVTGEDVPDPAGAGRQGQAQKRAHPEAFGYPPGPDHAGPHSLEEDGAISAAQLPNAWRRAQRQLGHDVSDDPVSAGRHAHGRHLQLREVGVALVEHDGPLGVEHVVNDLGHRRCRGEDAGRPGTLGEQPAGH
jgi:hypothetical protein